MFTKGTSSLDIGMAQTKPAWSNEGRTLLISPNSRPLGCAVVLTVKAASLRRYKPMAAGLVPMVEMSAPSAFMAPPMPT